MNEKELLRVQVDGALKLVRPWKTAFVVCNVAWAIVALVLSLLLYTGRPEPVACVEYRPGPAVEELQE